MFPEHPTWIKVRAKSLWTGLQDRKDTILVANPDNRNACRGPVTEIGHPNN
jgi:hypothetical protein